MSSIISNSSRVVPGLIEPPGGRVILEQVTPPDGQANPLISPIGDQSVSQPNFGDLLSNAINSVNDLQKQAGAAQEALLAGEPVELHDVMIKAEQAGLALDLTLEVRNKLVNAFNEIMRMPM
jgi:flagellar hook-basal body complex protein FliE